MTLVSLFLRAPDSLTLAVSNHVCCVTTDTDLTPVILDTWEYAITMICVCIPVCNPLWISWARKLFWSHSRRNQDLPLRARRRAQHRHLPLPHRLVALPDRIRMAPRGWRRQSQQQHHEMDEHIYNADPVGRAGGGGGIKIQIGGADGRVIRIQGRPLAEQQAPAEEGGVLGRKVYYATHTIGGSEMPTHGASDGGGTPQRDTTASSRSGDQSRKGGLRDGDSRAGTDTSHSRHAGFEAQPGADEEPEQPWVPSRSDRWAATATWFRERRDSVLLGSPSRLSGGLDGGHGSQIELRGGVSDPELGDVSDLERGCSLGPRKASVT